MKVRDVLTLDIEDVALGGKALGRVDGKVVFVDRGLPGDRVQARVTKSNRQTRFSMVMTISAVLTVVAGFLLYGFDSDWFTSAWQSSSPGIGFGIGAFFALIGLISGLVNGRNNAALGQLGAQIKGKPTPELLAKIQAVQRQQAMVVPINTYSLLLAVLFMATARYFTF